MADISQMNVNGTTYDIKDTVARASGVPSGGTTNQVLTKFSSGYGWSDVSGGGGEGINFDNLTLVKEHFMSLDYVNNVTVKNGIVVKVYIHYSDGDNNIDFYILPKQLINLVASGKNIAHSFNSNISFTITVGSHSGDVYNFRLDNDTNARMDFYTF
jgi:hypothetical protein